MRRQFRTWTGALLLGAAMAFSAACAEEPTAAAQAPSAPTNPDQVVAEVAGKPITLKDVDAKWEEFDAAERARIIQATYQNRRNMIDVLVGDQLIANAAKAARFCAAITGTGGVCQPTMYEGGQKLAIH